MKTSKGCIENYLSGFDNELTEDMCEDDYDMELLDEGAGMVLAKAGAGAVAGGVGGYVSGHIGAWMHLTANRVYHVTILKHLEKKLKKADPDEKREIQQDIKTAKEKISWIDKNMKRIKKGARGSGAAFGAVGGALRGALSK